MRTTLVAVALGLMAALASVAEAQSSPKIGIWKLNPSRSKLNGPPPRSETRIYEDRGGGVIHSTRKGVNARGEPFLSQYASKADGKDYPRLVKGSGAVSSIALTTIDDRSVSWVVKIDGAVAMTGTSVVSEDGQTLTTTVRGKDPSGQPNESISVYDRQ